MVFNIDEYNYMIEVKTEYMTEISFGHLDESFVSIRPNFAFNIFNVPTFTEPDY